MPLLGSHLSIAGGYYKAAEAAGELGMQTVQIFTKNNNQWRAKAISDDEAERFRAAVAEAGLQTPCSHDSYLINLASPKRERWQRSLDAFGIELQRAEQLGLAGVVMHPGSYTDSSPEEGLDRIVQGIDIAIQKTDGLAIEIWLETTAGQGTNLGHRFEHLAEIIDRVEDSTRIGVCIDTCHIFAAGYPLLAEADYRKTMKEFDQLIGLDRVRAFHLNDSMKEFGSRVDRHEHIGLGYLGLEPFRLVLNDRRFCNLPMYLETAKEDNEDGRAWDAVNLEVLQSLIGRKEPCPAPDR